MGVNGENPKMCNILKMADRTAKRTIIWDLWSYVLCTMQCTFHVWVLVGGHSVHFAKCLMLTFSKGCCSLSFSFNQTSEKVCNLGKYSSLIFSGDLPNFKYMAFWGEVYLSYTAIIHKAILVSPGQRSSRASRCMGFLLTPLLGPSQCHSMSNVVVSLDSQYMVS